MSLKAMGCDDGTSAAIEKYNVTEPLQQEAAVGLRFKGLNAQRRMTFRLKPDSE